MRKKIIYQKQSALIKSEGPGDNFIGLSKH
jgi:hypothetical protein